MPESVSVVSIAAPQDGPLLTEWETHLRPLELAGSITLWSEQHIPPGTVREESIIRHLEQADIIVLLVSSNFFANKECYKLMAHSLQRYQRGLTRVIPLLLRPSMWRSTPIGSLACLPDNQNPVMSWSNRDAAFQDCATGILRLLDLPATPIFADDQSQSMPLKQRTQSSSVTYHSCFLSYAHQDEHLAQRLYSDLQAQGVQCWSAAHNMKIGAKIRPTIDEAIQRQEKILILLSEHALQSTWIEDEVEAALDYERREQREMLFPVRLDESIMQTTQSWAAKLRRTRNIGDFTNWTEPQKYEQAFERLLGDLKKTN